MRKIWHGTSAANLINICHCIVFVVQYNWNYRKDQDWHIGSCESLAGHDFQNLLTVLAQFLQKCTWNQLNFNPIEIIWRKMICSVCLTPGSMAMWHLHSRGLSTWVAKISGLSLFHDLSTFGVSQFTFFHSPVIPDSISEFMHVIFWCPLQGLQQKVQKAFGKKILLWINFVRLKKLWKFS